MRKCFCVLFCFVSLGSNIFYKRSSFLLCLPQGGWGGGKRRGLGPRNDVLTTCKAVNPRASQRPSKAAVCFLTISTLALSFE